ncbi:MAG: LytTR family transcriptional regulator [Chitinophagaceae bacterium]|nr:MAG: LytTR family transcriptional regulator [Chitinophagaceae bacterium]
MRSYFFIHLNKRFVRVNVKDIRYVLSVDHHIKIFTDQEVLMPHLSLKQLEEKLPGDTFVRVNRGTLISLDRVLFFDKDTVFIKDACFSFSDKFKKEFDDKITLIIHKET